MTGDFIRGEDDGMYVNGTYHLYLNKRTTLDTLHKMGSILTLSALFHYHNAANQET